MIIHALVIGGIILLVFGLTDGAIGHAIAGFMLAGIIPGTSYQLPWYAIVLAAPIALIGLAKAFFAILAQDMVRKIILLRATELALTNSGTKKRTNSKRNTYIRRAKKSLRTGHAETIQTNSTTQAEA